MYVWVVLNLVLLFLAFVLRLFGANPEAGFTQWVFRRSHGRWHRSGGSSSRSPSRSVGAGHIVVVRDDRLRLGGPVPASWHRLGERIDRAAPTTPRAGGLGRPTGGNVGLLAPPVAVHHRRRPAPRFEPTPSDSSAARLAPTPARSARRWGRGEGCRESRHCRLYNRSDGGRDGRPAEVRLRSGDAIQFGFAVVEGVRPAHLHPACPRFGRPAKDVGPRSIRHGGSRSPAITSVGHDQVPHHVRAVGWAESSALNSDRLRERAEPKVVTDPRSGASTEGSRNPSTAICRNALAIGWLLGPPAGETKTAWVCGR